MNKVPEPLELPESTMVEVHLQSQAYSARIQTTTFQQYVIRLRTALPQLAKKWSEEIVQQTFIKIFRDDLQTLWYLCPPSHRDLCAMLLLALQGAQIEALTLNQVAAIQFVLSKIEQAELTELEIESCHEKLLEATLFLSFSLDDNAIQSYVDES